MDLVTFLPWALATGAITLGAWIGIVQYGRIERRRAVDSAARAAELEATRSELAELENRVEFAERLLEEGRQKEQQRR